MNFFLKNKSNNDGYTLVELLVVIAIVGILSSVVFFTVSSAREKSRMSTAKMYEANHIGALRNDLVAEWKFDDPSNRYLDSSGNEHSGSCSGSSCPVVALGEGFNGKDALRFDGVNDLIRVGVGNNYFPLNNFTVCSWFKTSGVSSGMSYNSIMGITYGFTLALSSNGAFRTRLSSTTSAPFTEDNSSLHDNNFHHACVNYDGANRKTYVDGKLTLIIPTSWTGSTYWPTNVVDIGRDTNNSTSYFFGLIDDTRIYSSYLTASEIQRLYAEETAQRKLADAN